MEDRYDLKIRARYARRVISIGLVCNLLLMILN